MVGFTKRSLVVEFFGLPGSGKSYSAARICAILRDRGVRVIMPIATITRSPLFVRIPLKSVLALLFAMLHLPAALRTTRFVWESRQRSLHDAVAVVFNLLFVLGVLRRYQHRRVVLVFDQGTVQALVSVLYSARRRPTERMLAFLPPPDYLVYMTADKREIIERLRARHVQQSRVETDPLGGIIRTQRRMRALERTAWYAGVRSVVPLESVRDTSRMQKMIETVAERIHDAWYKERYGQNG